MFGEHAGRGAGSLNTPEAGLAVNPADTEALRSALCRLLTMSPEWQTWSEQAQRRYATNFTARHFQQRLLRPCATARTNSMCSIAGLISFDSSLDQKKRKSR